MIVRIIGLLVVLIVLYRVYMAVEKRVLKKQIEKKTMQDQSKMEQCHQCGLYIPKNEIIEEDKRSFCSSECVRAYLDDNSKES